MDLAWGLEPTEFCAYLVSPLSACVIDVNFLTVNLAARSARIPFRRISLSNLVCNNFLEDLMLGLADVWLHRVAHFYALSILNRASWDVSVE